MKMRPFFDLLSFIFRASVRSLNAWLPTNSISRMLELRPFADVEGDVDQLRAAGHRCSRVGDLGVGEPLLRHHLVKHALNSVQRVFVEEGIQPQLDAAFSFSCSAIFVRSMFFDPW